MGRCLLCGGGGAVLVPFEISTFNVISLSVVRIGKGTGPRVALREAISKPANRTKRAWGGSGGWGLGLGRGGTVGTGIGGGSVLAKFTVSNGLVGFMSCSPSSLSCFRKP